MAEKILTIVVPVYKVENYINKCLDSLLMDDDGLMDQLEVLIVNDGTPDKSAEMSREYVKRYPRTFRQIDKENGGHGSAWNIGLKEAKGKYIRFLDSDDWLTNIESFIKLLLTTEVDIVITAMNIHQEKDNSYSTFQYATIIDKETLVKDESFTGNMSNFWCATYKTALLKPLYPLFLEKVSYDDSILYIVPHILAKSYIAYDIVLYNYLIGRDGQSMATDIRAKKIPDLFKNYHHMYDFIEKWNGGKTDAFIEDVMFYQRWGLFNVIPLESNFRQSLLYMRKLEELGDLSMIHTNKYRRYRLLPYRLFHYLENKKRH